MCLVIEAKVTYTHPVDGAETIAVNGHEIQYGYGSGGDGFCYAHQSFECADRLTAEEKAAVNEAV